MNLRRTPLPVDTYRKSWNEDHDMGLGKPVQGRGKSDRVLRFQGEVGRTQQHYLHMLGSSNVQAEAAGAPWNLHRTCHPMTRVIILGSPKSLQVQDRGFKLGTLAG